MTLPANFWSKTAATDCVVWQGAQNSKGYGCFAVDGVAQLAHRVAWEDANGPIPEGLTIDHRCRVRCCVNVSHMELVSIAENNRRKFIEGGLRIGVRCVNGHLITANNAYQHPRGHIECRTCRREQRAHAEAPRRGRVLST